MPAPRAVLADLLANRMDPGKPWTITDKGGHLTPTPKPNAAHAGQHLNQVKFEPAAKATEAVKPVEKPTPAPKPVVRVPPKAAPVAQVVVPVAPAPVADPAKEEPKVEVVAKAEVKVEEPEAEKPAS